MANYSDFIFNALNGVGDAVVDNRNRATQVAINSRDYARQLGLDQTARAQDARDFAFREGEAARVQRNADREYALQARTADRADAAAANPSTDDIKEWLFARKNGYGGNFYDYQTGLKSASAKVGPEFGEG